MDNYSTNSVASKASREKQKSNRFSLSRLSFFTRRQSTSAKSMRSLRSVHSEIESRSLNSLPSDSNTKPDDVASTSTGGGHLMECPLCLSQQAAEAFPMLSTCHHRSCGDCLRQYLRIEIMESRVNISCPECAERLHPNDICAIVNDASLIAKYEEFMMRRVLVAEHDVRWCPAPDCSYAVIATGCASCPMLRCARPGCNTLFCYHCKQFWHPNQTCDSARAERSTTNFSTPDATSHVQSEIKSCPRCSAFIIKMDDGSCNHMTCAVCGSEFCWLCMKEISDLHYLSPSGCTFWGKKPWTRKKKILWQLGTLVGAPVGIGLVAGIAVPAMIIGIPVWVGRKLHTKYQFSSKHKRNLIISGGVSASVILSPVLAGLAVGIGVPILLAYVYGVVPISLCRSGGCGVTTNSGGVHFEFEEDNDGAVGVSSPYKAVDGQSVDAISHNLANPSIGPSIGEMSVGMTNSLSASGSHIDRVGLLRDGDSDRDSASNRAIIGTSLSGSLSGSAVAGPSGFQNRLEVQADVTNNMTSNKRNSLSSENFSLDARSATVSFGDNASTKALAGSICTRDKDNISAVMPPLEVQVDVIGATPIRQGSEDSQGLTLSTTHTDGGKVPTSPGSPASTRSVNFLGEEIIGDGPLANRTKRFDRHSLSIGDSIHEHAQNNPESLSVRNPESMSVRSYTDEDYRPESAMKKTQRKDSRGAVCPYGSSASSFDVDIHAKCISPTSDGAQGDRNVFHLTKSVSLQQESSSDPSVAVKKAHEHTDGITSILPALSRRREGSKHRQRRRKSNDQVLSKTYRLPKVA